MAAYSASELRPPWPTYRLISHHPAPNEAVKPDLSSPFPVSCLRASTVPLAESERMVEIFKKFGVTDIQLSVDPEARHDSWTKAYADPKLYDWFLTHRRP